MQFYPNPSYEWGNQGNQDQNSQSQDCMDEDMMDDDEEDEDDMEVVTTKKMGPNF